jgi:transcriptional regulator with XRE-family HTH domain
MKSVQTPTYKAAIGVLKAAREKAGITQQELAKRLGRPQSFVAKYERCERRIDVAEFVRISEAVGANPLRLFGLFAKRSKR